MAREVSAAISGQLEIVECNTTLVVDFNFSSKQQMLDCLTVSHNHATA